MFNKPNEIGTKLTTVEMMGSGLEMTSEALEKSTEALEMYHEAMNAAVMEAAETELAEDALELTEDEKTLLDTLGDFLEDKLLDLEAGLNLNVMDAPMEGSSPQSVCRASQTPQNYCTFSGSSRR